MSSLLPLELWISILDQCSYETIETVAQVIQIPNTYKWNRLKAQMELKFSLMNRPTNCHLKLGKQYVLSTWHYTIGPKLHHHHSNSKCCGHKPCDIYRLSDNEKDWEFVPDRYCLERGECDCRILKSLSFWGLVGACTIYIVKQTVTYLGRKT